MCGGVVPASLSPRITLGLESSIFLLNREVTYDDWRAFDARTVKPQELFNELEPVALAFLRDDGFAVR